LVPQSWSREDSSGLVRATETLGVDRIRIIPISARRMTSDRRQGTHGGLVFLRGESRFSVTVTRSRQSSRPHGNRQHPYRALTRTTQATLSTIYRQRCLRVTRSPEIQSVISLRRETPSSCFTLVTPARLPRHCCLTRTRNALIPALCSFGSGSRNVTAPTRRTGPRPPNVEDMFFEPQAHMSRRPRSPFSGFPNVRLEAQSVHSAGRLTTLHRALKPNKTER
jgi:hypothetical protein